jgi:histidinol-phosphatase (PHP family)
VWKAYTEALEELSGTGTCDVLAHPDLIKLLGRYPDEGLLVECYDRMAEAAAANNLAVEINSAGWRKPVGEAYPAPDLLRRFFLRGVPVTLASDAHGDAGVAHRSAELAELARAAGYGSLRAFRGRKGVDVPIGSAPESH